MKLTTSATFSILLLLTSQTLASPIQLSDSDGATTSLPAVVNDDADVAAQEISTTRPARQEEAVDEDEDDEVTEITAAPSTAAPVPRPQYNESNVQSELNFISQFNLGPNGSDSSAPVVQPPAPPVVGAPVSSPSSTTAPQTPVQSSSANPSAAPAAAVQASSSSAPVTNEGDEDEDEADEDSEQTEAPQLLRQPQESGVAAPVGPNVPVAAAAAAPQPPKPASPSQAVPQPQAAASAAQTSAQKLSAAIVPQVAVQPAEVDADNENEGDADNDTENEITQDEAVKTAEESVVATTAPPSTFESEYNYTIQYINDNQEARKNV